jgi:DNA-3-methyladenine glycosylase
MARPARSFFARPTATVARELLGWRLARELAGAETIVGRIVEAEAYPPGDPASHCFRGRTPRCAQMFEAPATAYVYRIYGMYWCLNVVTEPEGVGAAVLIRGLDGVDGCDGPSKLCRRLAIDGAIDGAPLLDPRGAVRLLPPRAAPPEPVVTTTRIGLSRAADWRLRFYLAGSPGVSRRDRAAEAAALSGASYEL